MQGGRKRVENISASQTFLRRERAVYPWKTSPCLPAFSPLHGFLSGIKCLILPFISEKTCFTYILKAIMFLHVTYTKYFERTDEVFCIYVQSTSNIYPMYFEYRIDTDFQ